jgi:hypothetical protein
MLKSFDGPVKADAPDGSVEMSERMLLVVRPSRAGRAVVRERRAAAGGTGERYTAEVST